MLCLKRNSKKKKKNATNGLCPPRKGAAATDHKRTTNRPSVPFFASRGY